MKKDILISVFGVLIVFLFMGRLAIGDGVHGRYIDEILAKIREEQRLGPNEQIDPDRVSDENLAELGDALMDIMHPDEREHEFKEEMIGGEGSNSLESMHRMMGYRYLSGGFQGPRYPMMGRGLMGMKMIGGLPMMGWGMHDRPGRGAYGAYPVSRMGGFWSFYFGRIIMWVILLAIICVVIWLVVRSQKLHGSIVSSKRDLPLDIAKQRYAKGEISREEFETLKRDLQ